MNTADAKQFFNKSPADLKSVMILKDSKHADLHLLKVDTKTITTTFLIKTQNSHFSLE